ncbi:hypothetical protein A2U01_0047328, partial [Trifolium medium]|nr:hypothetical protein [Trifolium medium]
KANKDEVLAELMEVSKALGEIIRISTTRKIHVDNLIKYMTQEAKETGNEEGEAEKDTAESSHSGQF